MYETINKQALALGKQFTNNMIKAQGETLKTLEKISSIQMKAFESQASANAAFAGEAAKATDLESMRALWDKSADFSRESAEKAYAVNQNVLEILAKNAETVGELAREQYEAGNEAVNASVDTAGKKAKK
ncbi:MAG: phasin family protein [Rhodanobacteraceae bacterium]